jgi:hypothetical protein
MPSASRPGPHFRVEFHDATFAEDLEHTSSDTGQALAQRARDRLTAEGCRPTSSNAATLTRETAPACPAASAVVAITILSAKWALERASPKACLSGRHVRQLLRTAQTAPVTTRSVTREQTTTGSLAGNPPLGVALVDLAAGCPDTNPIGSAYLLRIGQLRYSARPRVQTQMDSRCHSHVQQ